MVAPDRQEVSKLLAKPECLRASEKQSKDSIAGSCPLLTVVFFVLTFNSLSGKTKSF